MNPTARLAVSMLALTALGGCYVQAGAAARPYQQGYSQEGYVVDQEPPPPPAEPAPEAIPAPRSKEDVWVKGHYGWKGRNYSWEKGHYERRPNSRANWVPAHWEVRGKKRAWVDGHWS